jgi:EmrB/QacA subfamily drug resistance transporter
VAADHTEACLAFPASSPGPGAPAAPAPRRWQALAVISVSQLMISVDSTIVNIALPSAQQDLGFSAATRQWVLTAYLLAFGGLLLLGGRIADLAGRKRVFLAGVTGFAAASVLGGTAADTTVLIAARALQGTCAALMAPAALSLITDAFPDSGERTRALGIFSAIAGSGAAVGLIAGGALTQYLSWRWSLLVNAPIGLAVAASAALTVGGTPVSRGRRRLDITGAVLVSAALMALILGLSQAETAGWTAPTTPALLAASAVLTAVFVQAERRAAAPLLPLRLVTDRTRAGVYLSQALSVMTMFGLLLFLTYDLQTIDGYSALKTGTAFLPLVAGMLAGASLISGRLPRVPPRWLMGTGCLISAAGMLFLTALHPGSPYWSVILPAAAIFGLGLGIAFTPAMHLATRNVKASDTGIASGLINASQQIGGATGAALLNTIAATAAASWLRTHPHTTGQLSAATVHGYAIGARWATAILLLAALIAFTMVNTGRTPDAGSPHGAPSPPDRQASQDNDSLTSMEPSEG